MPTQTEFDDLKARVEAIERIPTISARLGLSIWPQRSSFEDLHSTGEDDKRRWELKNPKSKALVAAELAVEEAQKAHDLAQRALLDASRDMGGRFMSTDAYGNSFVTDVPPDAVVQTKRDIPEFAASEDAERKLVAAKMKLYGLARERERQRVEDDRKVNRPNPPNEEKDSHWSKRVRLAAFGGGK